MEEDNENIGVCKSCGREDMALNVEGRCEVCAGSMDEDVGV